MSEVKKPKWLDIATINESDKNGVKKRYLSFKCRAGNKYDEESINGLLDALEGLLNNPNQDYLSVQINDPDFSIKNLLNSNVIDEAEAQRRTNGIPGFIKKVLVLPPQD